MGNIFHKNMALLFKWFWRFFTEPKSLWRLTIQNEYGYGPTFTIHDLSPLTYEGIWRSLCNIILRHKHSHSLIANNIHKRIGNGSHTLLWHDLWVGEAPLKNTCPRLFLLSSTPDAFVSSCGFWDGNTWCWSLSWKRLLRHHDIQESEKLNSILEREVLSHDGTDHLIWTPDKLGRFTVKNFGP